MKIAFKEWAIVVDALGHGKQVLILRKGGMAEDQGKFAVEHDKFLLCPTWHHQQREMVLPAAQERFDIITDLHDQVNRTFVVWYAEVAARHRLDSLATVQRLCGQHIWREEVVAERFSRGNEPGLHALVVRVYRLPEVVEVPNLPAYAGCKSWIELAEDVSTEGAQPVLIEPAFQKESRRFHAAVAHQ
jgi:hypothetical protein